MYVFFLMDFIPLCCDILISVRVLRLNTTQFIKFISECYMFRSYRQSSGNKIRDLKYMHTYFFKSRILLPDDGL
jgi:hypothetical protein